EIAVGIFATNHEEGFEYVVRQPETEQEFQLVAEAMKLCPASAIRDNG
ncbi:MAG: ferredoxin, partial [Proteobacteria bacterium]|nr:ferredoxin [Pseudomonadota bacterium]